MVIPFRKYLFLATLIFLSGKLAAADITKEFDLFDFEHTYPPLCDESQNHCWGLEELVKKSIESGLEARGKILDLYKAHKTAHARGTLLLPEINIISAINAGMDKAVTLEAVIPLVGFLLPSRWFDFRSSRYIRKAEREGLVTILGNAAQNVQEIYLDIQHQIWSIRVLEFYHAHTESIISFFQKEREDGLERLSLNDIATLENINGKFMYERAFVDALSASLPRLATLIGLNPEVDWSSLKINLLPLEPLTKLTKKHYSEFSERAFTRSSELRVISALISSARHDKRSTYFDFIDPASGNNLGFAIGPRIKIARTNIAILENQFMKTKMEIGNAIQDELNNYNDAVESLPAIQSSLLALSHMKDEIEKQINDKNSSVDFNSLFRLIKYSKGTAIRYINAYFILKKAEAKLHRLTWSGEIYDIVNDYRFYEISNLLREIRKELSWRHLAKNKLKHLLPRRKRRHSSVTTSCDCHLSNSAKKQI